jgi:glycosyltransferase involved in cell wall biosynthesis
MRVSVVICAYDPDLFGHLQDAIESVLHQNYDDAVSRSKPLEIHRPETQTLAL